MPKATSPFLASLRGTLKGGPTFRDNPQTDAITMQTKPVPTDRRTAKQAAVRDAYSRLAWLWKNLSHLDKEPYQIMAEARGLTPWNCWLSFHLPLMRLTPSFYTSYAEGAGTTLQNFAIGGTSGTINGPIFDEKNSFPCLSFDGVDDGITFPHTAGMDGTQQQTVISVFQCTLPGANWQQLLNTGMYGTSPTGFTFLLNSSLRPTYYLGNNSTYEFKVYISRVVLNQFTVIAHVFDGPNSFLYINGLKENHSFSLPYPKETTSPLRIGLPQSQAYDFKGLRYIDAILPTALSFSDLASLDAHYQRYLT